MQGKILTFLNAISSIPEENRKNTTQTEESPTYMLLTIIFIPHASVAFAPNDTNGEMR